MRKRWLVTGLHAGLLSLAVIGGTAVAQEAESGGDTPLKSFVTRVADILGLGEAEVQDALNQAATEMRDEALQLKLDYMVEKGVLTQEEADEYGVWYQSRPDTLSRGFSFGGFGGHGFFRGRMWGGHGFHGSALPTTVLESSNTT